MKPEEIESTLDAVRRTLMHTSKVGPYSRDKALTEFTEFYKPKPFGTKKNYPRNFPVIYAAAKDEKLMFFSIIRDVVNYLQIPEKYYGNGRPTANVSDIIKNLCIQTYCRSTHWRVNSELVIAQDRGVVDNIYKKTALCKYMNQEELTLWLHKVYQTIAAGLGTLEVSASADASGMSVQYGRRRWVEVRDQHQLHKDYKKLHIISGAKTNMVYAVHVTDGRKHESPILKRLIKDIKGKFSFREFSADSGYLSRKNVDLIASNGMEPYIMPKKNTRSLNKGSSGAWGKMIWFALTNPDLFKFFYHKRSNVEATFGMIKKRFGYEVRSKSLVGQTNEILTKIICHNIVVLSRALLEFSLNPEFMKS